MLLTDDTALILSCWNTVAILAATGIFLNSAEWLSILLRVNAISIVSWDVSRLRTGFLAGTTGSCLTPFLSDKSMVGLVVCRLCCSGAIVYLIFSGTDSSLPIIILALVNVLLFFRAPYGLDGADQMWVQISVALSVTALSGENVKQWALVFIGAQSILSYFLSGMAKLKSNYWRSEGTLADVFSTKMYGHVGFKKFCYKRPKLDRALILCVIALQLLSPAFILFGDIGFYFFAFSYFSFHLFNTVFMGLPWFLISFSAAYPGVYFLAVVI